MRPFRFVAVAAAAILAAGGCSASGGGSADDTIAVTATDDSCQIAETELPPGTHTFAVTNDGSTVTEFYVYAGDTVVSEVEDIAPGTTRDLTVELEAGEYEGACKPGMTGDGIGTPISVS